MRQYRGHTWNEDRTAIKCDVCGKFKPLEKMDPNSHMASGYRNTCARCANLKRLYGITGREYDALLEKQGGVCAICEKAPEPRPVGRRRTLSDAMSVDHDHAMGKVRALLCQNCNAGVGAFLEDVALMRKAIAYVERWQTLTSA